MQNWKIKLSLFINYFVFAILLNSVGIVILQVVANFGVPKEDASILEACKDLSIAGMSFLISGYITKWGYKNSMLIALAFMVLVCFIMPSSGTFAMTKLLFVAIGIAFALIKMSVYSTIGLVTKDEKEHISLMNFIESFFMVGSLTGYFLFSYFIDDKNPTSTAWFNVYYVLGGLSLIAFLLLWSSPLDESSAKKQADSINFASILLLLEKPKVVLFLLSIFFYVLIEQSIQSWLPTFNKEILKLPLTLSIQMASILAGSIALGRFFAGIVMQRLNWLVVLLGCLVLAAGLILVTLPLSSKVSSLPITGWGSAPLVAFIFPMIGLLLAPIYPAVNSVILSALPKKDHGVMSGLIIVFSALGGTIGSRITGTIFQRYGGQNAIYFILVPIGILMFFLFKFRKLLKNN
jgi:MFS transporter, FHS family, glucose/mannose:H+ symporter